MSNLIIQPFPPRDGNDEWECQCARCGSSCDWQDCYNCEDGGCGSDCCDDLCHGGECIHGDSGQIQCDICQGHSGWWACLSGSEFCNANPIKGRENISRGKIEWFTLVAAPMAANESDKNSATSVTECDNQKAETSQSYYEKKLKKASDEATESKEASDGTV